MIDRGFFAALADALCVSTDGADRVLLHVQAEASQFIRFNRGAVRQATQVSQGMATLAVVRRLRRIESTLTLSGRLDDDLRQLREERDGLVAQLDAVADDPYLLLPEAATHSEREDAGQLPAPEDVVNAVADAARGLDFVGFYAGGPMVRAFADSLGSRHWHRVESFHFDWCLYAATDKAVKTAYAGTRWHRADFAERVAQGARQLPLLALPARQLAPGAYRAYFAPAAMAELLGTLGWSGFSLKARRSGGSSLARLTQDDARLSPLVTISEDCGRGITPSFTADGFVRPAEVALIERGRVSGTLNSPRSAREFGLPANGANAQEAPDSLRLAPGTLADAGALAALDTGLWVSNLWYLNYSDRPACRMTGMTRFACLWVENGRPIAPLGVMRFDDSFLRMFGDGLVALGERAELIPDNGTYQQRQLGSITTPGALVSDWRLTL